VLHKEEEKIRVRFLIVLTRKNRKYLGAEIIQGVLGMMRGVRRCVRASCMFLILLLGMFLLAPLISASEWKMALHDSCNTGYTNETIPDEPELLWSYEIPWWEQLFYFKREGYRITVFLFPERISSYPVVADGKVFVIFNNKLYAFDADTGKIIWSYKPHSFEGLPFSSVIAIDDGKLFVKFDKIYAFNADTGKIIWSVAIKNVHSIAVAEGKLYVISEDPKVLSDKIYILDEDTGDLIRCFRIENPVGIAVANGKIFVRSFHKRYVSDEKGISSVAKIWHELNVLDGNTGKILWKHELGENVAPFIPIVIADGKVFVGSEEYSKIYALDEDTGDLIWCYNLTHNIPSSIAIAPGKVFVSTKNGKIYALDEDTGDLIWCYEIIDDSYKSYISSMVITDEKVFVGTEGGKICALNVDTGDLIWSYDLGKHIYSMANSIAIADRKVFVCAGGVKIYCFGAREGKSVSGFEVIFALAGLLVIAYLLRRK